MWQQPAKLAAKCQTRTAHRFHVAKHFQPPDNLCFQLKHYQQSNSRVCCGSMVKVLLRPDRRGNVSGRELFNVAYLVFTRLISKSSYYFHSFMYMLYDTAQVTTCFIPTIRSKRILPYKLDFHMKTNEFWNNTKCGAGFTFL